MPTVDTNMLILAGLCALGVVARTLIPFLRKLQETPDLKFDRYYFVPAAVSVVLNLLAVPTVLTQLPAGANWLAAYLLGYGTTDQSNDIIKWALTLLAKYRVAQAAKTEVKKPAAK